jgi:hypothetical protein
VPWNISIRCSDLCNVLFVWAYRGFDIHAANPPDTAVFIALFYKLSANAVFDHHDLAPEMYLARSASIASGWFTVFKLMKERFPVRKSRDCYKPILQKHRNTAWACPEERITVVRNGLHWTVSD